MTVSFSKYSTPLLILLLCSVLISALIFSSLDKLHYELLAVEANRDKSLLLTNQLRHSSDELTRLVRTYAATGNKKFEQQYWEVLAIRNGQVPSPKHYDRVYWDFLAVDDGKAPYKLGNTIALRKKMEMAGLTNSELNLLNTSHDNSDALVALEMAAFNAMIGLFKDDTEKYTIYGDEDQQLAIDILHSEEYHKAKISIMEPINLFYEKLDTRTRQEVKYASSQLLLAQTLSLSFFIVTIITIIFLIITFRRYHSNLVEMLNVQVKQRTKKLEQSKQQLQKALDEIRTLKGILSICSYCHSIKNDKGEWEQLEAYISHHSDAHLSHGFCPKCESKARSDFNLPKSEQ